MTRIYRLFIRGAIGLAALWLYIWTLLALWGLTHG